MSSINKIYIASDHAGFEMKNKIIEKLSSEYEFVDLGTNSNESVDYPTYAFNLCKEVLKTNSVGILVCGTGFGMAIAANKVKGIRCAHVTNALESKLSKMHNNANVMAFGAKNPDAIEMVKIFLETSFSNEERHVRRCEEIIKIENGEYNV